MYKSKTLINLLFFAVILFITEGCTQNEYVTADSNSGVLFFIDHKFEKLNQVQDGPNGELLYVGRLAGDAYIKAIDKDGIELWDSRIGGEGLDEFYGVIPTSDNGYLAFGATSSNSLRPLGNRKDGLVVKYSSAGSVQWKNNYGDMSEQFFVDAVESIDGHFYLTGGSVPQNLSTYALKMTTGGDEVWDQTLEIGPWHDLGREIGIAPNGNIFIIGLNSISNLSAEVGNYQTYYLELEQKFGAKRFERQFTEYAREIGSSAPEEMGFDAIFENGHLTWAESMTTSDYKRYVHLVQTTYDGTVIFEKEIYGEGVADLKSIQKVGDGFIICGITDGLKNLPGNVMAKGRSYVLRLDSKGSEIWSNSIGEATLFQRAFASSFQDGHFQIGGESWGKDGVKLVYSLIDENGENQLIK